MSTVNIIVTGNPDISGSFDLDVSSLRGDGTYYKVEQVLFPMRQASFSLIDPGKAETLSGTFTISDVGDNYADVTFTGTYVAKGGHGEGKTSWTGTHPRGLTAGSDPWTSDTATPEGEPELRAKSQAS